MKKAVILLSGGLDSATILALAIRDGYECHSLGFAYGQRHNHEVAKATQIAARYGVHHKIVTIDLSTFGGSALTDNSLTVPKNSSFPPSFQEGNHLLSPSFQEGVGGWSGSEPRPYNSLNISKARDLRNNPTEAEKLLWNKLKSKQLNDHKFRRQEPLGNYIADFICLQKKLIIELDGGQHALNEDYDRVRTEFFEGYGYRVLRFWNNEVMENLDGVLHIIADALITTPQPPPERRGRNTHLPRTSPPPLRREIINSPPPLRRGLGGGEIPITYVPARNTIFLSYALAYAEVISASDIFIGVNAIDYSGYPDCRPEYIAAFEKMANLGTKAGNFKIHTPLINLSKAEIMKLGLAHGVDYSMTTSCYDPIGEAACGACDACILRLKGFEENGIKDPINYV